MLTLPHHQHGTRPMAHHSFRRAAEKHLRQLSVAVCADDDQVGVRFLGGLDDFVVRRSRAHVRLDAGQTDFPPPYGKLSGRFLSNLLIQSSPITTASVSGVMMIG